MGVIDERHEAAAAAGDTTALGRTAARAVLWNYLSFASGKVLVLVTMAILARLLTPEEFGVMGFAVLAVTYLAVLKDLGLGGALIQRRDDTEDAAQTVYVANLALGVILTAATYAAAPVVAGFFDEPLVTPLLRVLGFTFVLEALGAVHIVLLKRNLDFKRKILPDVGRALVKGIVSIGAALWGFGVWSLVWGQLAGVVTAVVLSWVVVPFRPTYRFHRRLAGPLMRFGAPLVFTDLAYAVWQNLDYVVIGRMLGDRALGVYTLAYRLPELLIQSIWRVVTQAAFPFFASIQKYPDMLARGFLATIRYSQLAIVPICVGLMVTADPIVGVVFGDAWAEAVPVMRLMGLFMLTASVGVNVGDVYKAIGRPDVLAKLAVVDFVVLAPALLAGAHYGGLIGVAWAHAGVALVDTLLRLFVAQRMVDVTFRQIGRAILPSIKAGTALALVSVGVMTATASLGDLVRLTLTALTGIVTYAAAVWVVDRAALIKIAGWIGLERFVPGEAGMTSPTPRLNAVERPAADISVLYLIDHLAEGGAEQVLLRYLTHLHGAGVAATVTAMQIRNGNPLAADIAALGIPVATLGIGRLRDRGALRRVRDHITQIGPDLVHTQLEFSNVLGTLAAARLGVPTITTLHTLDAPDRWSRDRLRLRLMSEILRRRADRVVAVSDSAREHHLETGRLRPERTITIHNGIDLEPFRSPPAGSRARIRLAYGIPPEAPVITTVAVHREAKGIQYMLEGLASILQRHPDAVYLAVGDGPYRHTLEAHAASLGVDRSVRFAGATADVPAHLAASDIFVLPSLTEALPTVIAEAMAASLPVVATTVGGIPEMVSHGHSGTLVDPASPAALADAIAHLIANPIQAAAMGRHGLRSARDRFSIGARAGELLEEYRHLVRTRR